jgi:hypothetical protein
MTLTTILFAEVRGRWLAQRYVDDGFVALEADGSEYVPEDGQRLDIPNELQTYRLFTTEAF